MKVVVDANRLIAALIRDSASRKIMFDERIQHFCPEFVKQSIRKHSAEIMKKSKLNAEELDSLLEVILKNVRVVPLRHYQKLMDDAGKLLMMLKTFLF